MSADQDTPSEADGQDAWARPISARLGETIVALTLAATGAFFAWQATLLDFGRVGLPGPGFFPFALGVGLALMALALLVHSRQGWSADAAVFIGHRNVLVTLLALAALAVAFERSDAYVAMGTFSGVMLLVVARTTLWRALLGAVLGMVAVWLFFGLALGVRIPAADFWGQLADAGSFLRDYAYAMLPQGQP